MRNKVYCPYNFDKKHEYRIYNEVGKRYFKNFMGKKIRRNDVKYSKFNKYLEWENYFKEKFVKNDDNDCNFLHYLIGELRDCERMEEIIKVLLVPVYIAMITLMITIFDIVLSFEDLYFLLLSGMIIIIIVCMLCYYKNNDKINFYRDCIKIIDDKNLSQYK